MTPNIEATNQWFKQVGERLVALRWGIILALVGINVLALFGVPKIRLDNSTESWFLEDDPMTIARNEFVETFRNDDYVGILVEADDVFAPEMLRLIRELGEELKENVPFADEVTSITDFDFTQGTDEGVEIGNIVPDEIPSDLQTIEDIRALAFSKKFLVNRLFSDDSRQAWISLDYPETESISRRLGRNAWRIPPIIGRTRSVKDCQSAEICPVYNPSHSHACYAL